MKQLMSLIIVGLFVMVFSTNVLGQDKQKVQIVYKGTLTVFVDVLKPTYLNMNQNLQVGSSAKDSAYLSLDCTYVGVADKSEYTDTENVKYVQIIEADGLKYFTVSVTAPQLTVNIPAGTVVSPSLRLPNITIMKLLSGIAYKSDNVKEAKLDNKSKSKVTTGGKPLQ